MGLRGRDQNRIFTERGRESSEGNQRVLVAVVVRAVEGSRR